MSKTMVENWPDAIDCSGDRVAIFTLSSAGYGEIGIYVQLFPADYRMVTFNLDGSFRSRIGVSSEGCEGQSIQNLEDSNRSFEFLSVKGTNSRSNSMIDGWPDAIQCGISPNEGSVFLLHGVNIIDAYYVQNYPGEYRYVRFNIDGTYNSRNGNDAASKGCEGKRISELEALDRTFGFIDNSEPQNSMFEDWPDAITCGIRSYEGDAIYLLHSINPIDAYYVQNYPENYRYIRFNIDGSYLTRGGREDSWKGCENYSIRELNEQGKTFNFVNNLASPTLSATASPSPSAAVSMDLSSLPQSPTPTPSSSPSVLPSATSQHNDNEGESKTFWEKAEGIGTIAASAVGFVGVCYATYVLWFRCKHDCMTPGEWRIHQAHANAVAQAHANAQANAGTGTTQTVPIGIDLEEDSISLVPLANSTVYFDYGVDGNLHKTSWVGANDAILVYDVNQNNNVDNANEIVLTNWCKEAKTDFDAIVKFFDTNGDKIFSSEDLEFKKFAIWQDKNQNGNSDLGELTDIQKAGISSINFIDPEAVTDHYLREIGALNTATIIWETGKVTKAYDLIFFMNKL